MTEKPLDNEDKLLETLVNENLKVKIINEDKNIKPLHLNDLKHPKIISLNEITKYKNFYIALHPFIIYGYRIHHNFFDCLKSIFKIHNETLNIWTHLIGTLFYVYLSFFIFLNDKFNSFTSHWVISFYLISVITCYFNSVLFHTFNCHSKEISNFVFNLDILGIILSLLSGVISNQYFMFHQFKKTRYFYILFYVTLSLLIININKISIFKNKKGHFFRTILIIILFVSSFASYLHWTLVADIEEIKIMTPYMIMAFVPTIIGFTFYLSKFPESYYQCEFVDLYLNSHSIWHLFVLITGFSYYYVLFKYNEILIKTNFIK